MTTFAQAQADPDYERRFIGTEVLPCITERDYLAVQKFAPAKGPGTLVEIDHVGHDGHPFKVQWPNGTFSWCCEVNPHG